MSLTLHHCQSEDDYWRIRAFLRDVFLRNGRQEMSWQPARLDYWRWHVNKNGSLHTIQYWQTPDDQIVAVLNPENGDDAFFHVDPDFKTPELEELMLLTAEKSLAKQLPDDKRTLTVWAHQHDTQRQEMFTQHGFTRDNWPESQWRRHLDLPLPEADPAPGYVVRALGTVEELPARSWLSWRVFHPDEPDDKYKGWEWYHNIQRQPMYRRDLDIVAVAPDGELAAFCTVWYDDVTRTGTFEPVGVSPDHRRRGLARAIMAEGLRQLHRVGGTLAIVGGYSEAANALYASMMSSDHIVCEPWVKVW